MRWSDLLLQSLSNLWRRKLRTILTMLGVLIGTVSIIMMISIGLGLQKSTREMYEGWGDLTKITINNYGGSYFDENGQEIRSGKLNDETLQQIAAIDHVTFVTPVFDNAWFLRITSGRYECYQSLTGVRAGTLEAFNMLPDTGRVFDPDARTIEIVAGNMTKENFQDTRATRYRGQISVDWLEDRFELSVSEYDENAGEQKVKEYKMSVVGVIGTDPDPNDPEAAFQYDERQNYILCEIEALKKILKNHRQQLRQNNTSLDDYQQVWVKVDGTQNVDAIVKYLNENMGLQAWSMAEGLEVAQQQAQSIQTALGAIGAVSMLVAALMIANTMLMSIYERTREIGVMKVLGCRLMSIRTLFLNEAGMIGLIGGIIGIGMSYGGSALINHLIQKSAENGGGGDLSMFSSYIPPWLPLVGIGFSIGIALLAGFYPAHRATRISALQAIRNDA